MLSRSSSLATGPGPFTNDVLLDAIGGAIERSRAAVRQESEMQDTAELLRVAHANANARS